MKLTAKELELLSSLVSDQLFRREFIDSRMPGYKSNPADLSLGKQLLVRLKTLVDRAPRVVPAKNGATGTTVLRRSRTTLVRGAHDGS